MSSLTDLLLGQLGDQDLSTLGASLGASPQATRAAASAAVPLLLSALAKNASTTEGATALDQALERDHDGSVLDGITNALTGDAHLGAGRGILKHVLGGRQSAAAEGVAQASGLDAAQSAQLMTRLAPLVMGALGRTKRSQGLDAGSLAGLLQGEGRAARARTGGLAQLLDRDGDGSVADDLIGGIGKLFGGR